MQTDTPVAQPVRVLMVVPQYPFPVVGGLEKQAHALSSILVRHGAKVAVLSGKIQADQAGFETIEGVEVYRLRWPRNRFVRWLASPWSFARAFCRLAREADVVHCHVKSGVGLFAIALARRMHKPVVVKLAGMGPDGLPGLRGGAIGRIRIALFRSADAVVAMSTESIRELDAIGYARGRILATPNGIDLERQPLASPGSAGPVRLVFVGRLSEEKAIPDLIAALSPLPRDGAWTLDILGEGPLRDEIAKQIQSEGLDGRVRLWGRVDNVGEHLAHSHVFVLPSLREGNSNAILEAMVAGLPIISTCVGGTPMLVGEEGRAWLHAPGDVAGLQRLLQRLIASPEERDRLGSAMRRRVEQSFGIQAVAGTYAQAYRLLAAGRREEMFRLANPVIAWPEKT